MINIKKNRNLIVFSGAITAGIIMGLSFGLGFGLGFKVNPSLGPVEQKNFGISAQKYLKNRNKWNLTYKDDAENAKLVNKINMEKFRTKGNIMYELLVYSFSDGNGDGIGDFQGATKHLDYLDKLNINSIWLSPINEAPSYHGYDSMDYVSVSNDLGGMQNFDAFLKGAHERGIKIYLDLVFNHTSANHPWFRKALEGNEEFRDYYQFDKGNGNAEEVGGELGDFFLAKNWVGMPDLNGGNDKVLKEFEYVIKFWTKKGVDGFRFDLFRDLYSPGEPKPKDVANPIQKLYADLKKKADDIRKSLGLDESFFLGEGKLNETSNVSLRFLTDGTRPSLNSIYDGGFLRKTSEVPLHNDNINDYNDRIQKLLKKSTGIQNYQTTWTPFLDNHDENRWIHNFRIDNNKGANGADFPMDTRDWTALRYALSSMLLFPGKPLFFQGDELGYHGVKPDNRLREPLLWEGVNRIKFRQYEAFGDTTKFSAYGDIGIDDSIDIGNVENHLKDRSSVLNTFISLAKIRGKYQWLSSLENKFVSITSLNANHNNYSGLIRRNANSNEEIILLQAKIDSDVRYDLTTYFEGKDVDVLHSENTVKTANVFDVKKGGLVVIRMTS